MQTVLFLVLFAFNYNLHEIHQPFKIVPLKEQVFRTLVIAWDENTSLSKQAINFLQFTKKWFENI